MSVVKLLVNAQASITWLRKNVLSSPALPSAPKLMVTDVDTLVSNGRTLSSTVTTAVALAVLPSSSVTVKTTSLAPTLEQSNEF